MKNKQVNEIKNVILLALIISILVYVIYSITALIKSPAKSIIVAKRRCSTEKKLLSGYVIREETLLNRENNGETVEKIKTEGEKVSKGDTIAKYYTIPREELENQIEEINNEIQTALESETNIFSSDINALDGQIESKLLQVAEKNNIQEINENKTDINN